MSHCRPLMKTADGLPLFEALADRPWSMLLDSGTGDHAGRYDIIIADPVATLVSRAGETEVRERDGSVRVQHGDCLGILRSRLAGFETQTVGLPFAGGAMGYFAYDLGRRMEGLPTRDRAMPDMAVGIYEGCVVVDRAEQQAWAVGAVDEDSIVRLSTSGPSRSADPFRAEGEVVSDLPQELYAEVFRRVHEYIREGDCYQVNLAQRFSVPVSGDPWDGYKRLRSVSGGPYSAYLNLPQGQIWSISPEGFLRVDEGRVVTRPIKGTRPRGTDPAKDRTLRLELAESEKDRAENLMIVDLLRNDLGKRCRVGSVTVPELFAVESFATVHHLVSTVTASLPDDAHALDLLASCLPGGSITGAPKRRAMEIIDELEPSTRGVYCGAIGHVGFDGNMDLNVAIRTLVHREGRLDFWAGGGIVADSRCEDEYRETFDKVAAVLRLLNGRT